MITDRQFIPFSQAAYASSCNLMLCKRYNKNFINDILLLNGVAFKLSHGDKIFAIPSEVPITIWKIICHNCQTQNIKLTFIFLDEPLPNPQILNLLLPYAINIFIDNAPFNNLPPNIHIYPIAIMDESPIMKFTPMPFDKKESLCLLRFMTQNNRTERGMVENELGNKQFVTNLNHKQIIDDSETKTFMGGNVVSAETFYTIVNKFKYVLDPAGCGVATHRFWESIYLNAIPIVKRTHTAFDKLYNFYPCLIVDNWSDVTEELLINKLSECQTHLTKFKFEYPNFFHDVNVSLDISTKHM